MIYLFVFVCRRCGASLPVIYRLIIVPTTPELWQRLESTVNLAENS